MNNVCRFRYQINFVPKLSLGTQTVEALLQIIRQRKTVQAELGNEV
jgi:hypothetical protein